MQMDEAYNNNNNNNNNNNYWSNNLDTLNANLNLVN
jgi:hypothetical protein